MKPAREPRVVSYRPPEEKKRPEVSVQAIIIAESPKVRLKP